MKKVTIGIGVLIVIAVLAVGAYFIYFKPPTATNGSSSNQSKVPAVNNAILMTKSDPTLGQYLTDPAGKTLYTYGGDSSGVSTCTGFCLATWPAYEPTGSTTSLPQGVGTIKRSDNSQTQYTYNGMPLYYFITDTKGRITGNGVSNFHVAVPVATPSSQPTATPSTAPSTPPTNSSSSGYSY
jgi:predicted lipoprotein with Yx(FWY)xxD motif